MRAVDVSGVGDHPFMADGETRKEGSMAAEWTPGGETQARFWDKIVNQNQTKQVNI